MIVSPILLKGPEFDERHVYWLGRQVARHWPAAKYIPWANVPLDGPHRRLEASLGAKWWAKMEIARDVREPTLVLDLDTVILGPVAFDETKPSVLRHPIAYDQIGCGIMLWTPEFAERLAAHYWANPRRHRAEANGDDQRYFRRHFGHELTRFQDYLPDQIISYKLTALPWGLTPTTKIVYFHGVPRPWHSHALFVPPLEDK